MCNLEIIDVLFLKIQKICEHLPRSRNDTIRINDFMNLPILSEEAFKAIDRYKTKSFL